MFDTMIEDMKKLIKKHEEDFLVMEKQMRSFEMLTEKRMQVIRTIMHKHPGSIRELAEFLRRDVKNVFDDLNILNKMGVIKFIRIGRKKRPVVKRKTIIISFE